MKLSAVLFLAAAAAVHAQGGEGEGTVAPPTEPPVVTEEPVVTSEPTEKPVDATTAPSSTTPKPSSTGNTNTEAGASTLDALKQKKSGYDYQMPMVRVVQARVQADKPEYVKDRFVSKFGKGDLKNGYMSALDTVNTASVEGALMFVQAEGINYKSRSEQDRCKRKNDMNYIVFYEILFAQSNETLAQWPGGWNQREYGPMMPMDSGMCTPLKGKEYPPECYMFNGDDGYPNVGPNVGAGLKNNDPRAPYPDNYWFSFPNTCPLKVWGEKEGMDAQCRQGTRKGMCDLGQAPDGIACTFAYDIIGWVPIDDVVGITALTDANGNNYGNFTSWCQASKDNVEFIGDLITGKKDEGLEFWDNPTEPEANSARANKVIELYQELIAGTFTSSQIDADDLKYFKELPNPENLAALNPPCYQTSPDCNSGLGCQRLGFSQLCEPCTQAGKNCKTDSSFTFPTLAKAPTTRSDDELSSGSRLSDVTGANGKKNGTTPDSPAAAVARSGLVTMVVASVAATAAVLAL